MREPTLALLLVIAAGCDRAERGPAGRVEVAEAAEAATRKPPAPGEAEAAAPGDGEASAPDRPKPPQPAADAGPVVLQMADGSGEPVRLGTLRDVHGLPLRLPGHTLVERATGFQLRAGESVALEIHAPPSDESRIVVTFRAPSIATAAGLAVGQRISDVTDRVADPKCYPSGGASGTSVSCDAGEGVTATFQLSPTYEELPAPMTLAQAEAAIGNETITELSWFSDAVPAPVTTTPRPEPARHGVLPAGAYWAGEGYSACELDLVPGLCVAAGAAVVAGVFEDASAAGRALEAVDASALDPGYPLVVHTDEIHPEREGTRGIAIVVGLFAGEPEAKDWSATHAALGKLEVVTLQGPRAARTTRRDDDDAKPRAVVRLRPGATRKKGECTLEGGTFAVVAADAIDDDVYERVPARCEDGSTTTIPWRDTLVEAVVVRTQKGPQLLQLVGAECDQPEWRRWPLDADGTPKGKGARAGKRGGC